MKDLIRSSYDVGDCKCVTYIEEDTWILLKKKVLLKAKNVDSCKVPNEVVIFLMGMWFSCV